MYIWECKLLKDIVYKKHLYHTHEPYWISFLLLLYNTSTRSAIRLLKRLNGSFLDASAVSGDDDDDDGF